VEGRGSKLRSPQLCAQFIASSLNSTNICVLVKKRNWCTNNQFRTTCSRALATFGTRSGRQFIER